MKNYYEILEVDKKASPEVIEKAYKTLVKKYHPDLQNNENQKEYEEKMKDINEAYSILIDDYKRETYDEQLQTTTISKSEYDRIVGENKQLKNRLEEIINNLQKNNNSSIKQENQNIRQSNNTISNMNKVFKEQIRQVTSNAYNKAYQDAYVEDMKNREYRVEYKHDLKYYLKFFACIIIIILLCMLIYQIPVVKRFFAGLYEENILFRAIVNIFKNTFQTGF